MEKNVEINKHKYVFGWKALYIIVDSDRFECNPMYRSHIIYRQRHKVRKNTQKYKSRPQHIQKEKDTYT